jgi:hypothetical protein
MRRSLLWLFPMALLHSLSACSQHPSPAPSENKPSAAAPLSEANPMSEANASAGKSMNEVQEEHQKRLLAIPGVLGIGQGISQGKPCFRIYVDKLTPDLSAKIPTVIEGYPVVVLQTGEIKAH